MPDPSHPLPPPHPADIPIPDLPKEDFDRIMGEAMKKAPAPRGLPTPGTSGSGQRRGAKK